MVAKALAYLQQKTKTDVRYVFKNGLWLSISQAIATIAGLALTFGLIALLDQAQYGNYVYILSIATILGALSLTGINTSVINATAQGYDGTVFHAARVQLLWSLPASALALIGSGYYLWQDNHLLGFALLAISITTPLLNVFPLYSAYFNGKKQFKRLAYENGIRNVIVTAATLAVAVLYSSALVAIITYLLVSTLAYGWLFARLWYRVPQKDQIDKSAIGFGKHLSVMNFLAIFSTNLDRLIIFQFLGATPLAIYSLALAPVRQMSSVGKIIRALALPRFAERNTADIRANLKRKVWLLFLIFLGLLAVYQLTVPYLIILFFPSYADSIPLTQVLGLSLLAIPFNMYMHAFTAQAMKRELYTVQIFKTVSRTLLFLLTVPFYGLWGAVISIVVINFAMSVLAYGLMHWRQIEP